MGAELGAEVGEATGGGGAHQQPARLAQTEQFESNGFARAEADRLKQIFQ